MELLPLVRKYFSEVMKFDFYFSIQTFRNFNSCDVNSFLEAGPLKSQETFARSTVCS